VLSHRLKEIPNIPAANLGHFGRCNDFTTSYSNVFYTNNEMMYHDTSIGSSKIKEEREKRHYD
jgi:hypothetical protein